MGIRDWIRKKAAKKEKVSGSSGIGSPVKKFSEQAKQSGGYVSVSSPSVPKSSSGGVAKSSKDIVSSGMSSSISKGGRLEKPSASSSRLDAPQTKTSMIEQGKSRTQITQQQIRELDIKKRYAEPIGTQVKQQRKTPELKIAKPGEILIEQKEIGRTKDGVPIIETIKITERGETKLLTKEELEELYPKRIEAVKKKSGLERLEQLTIEAGNKAEIKAMRDKEGIKPFVAGAAAFGAGAASSLVGTGIFFKEAITKPVATAKAIPRSLVTSAKGISRVGEQLRVAPSFTLGKIAGEAVIEGVSGVKVVKSVKAGYKIKKLGDVSPTVKISSKFKEVSKKIDIESFEPEFKKQVEKGRITETREFNVDIPSPQGKKIEMKVVEYFKDGQSKFAGVVTENGKVKQKMFGVSDIGDKGAFTKIIQAELKKKGFKRIEIKEFIDEIKERTRTVRPGRIGEIVKADVSLLRKVVKKPEKFRPIKEGKLQEIKQIEFIGFKKRKKPFTEAESAQAKKIGESVILTEKRIDVVKKTKQQIDIMGDVVSKEKGISVKMTPDEVRIAKQIPKQKSMIATTGKITKKTVTKKGFREGIATFVKTAKEPVERTRIINIGSLNGKPIKATKIELLRAIKKIEKKLDTKTPVKKYKMELAKKLDKELNQIKERPASSLQYIAEEIKTKGIKRAKSKTLVSGIGFGVATIPKVKPSLREKVIISNVTKQAKVDLLKPAKQPDIKTTIDFAKAKVTETGQLLASKLSTIQKQKLKKELLIRQRVDRVATKPKQRVKAVPKYIEERSERINEALERIKAKGQSVDIVTGLTGKKKGTVYKKNLPPKKAFMEAQKYVDRNIEASFKLRTNKKKPKGKDIKKIKVSNKFTSAKTNPLYLKEKAKYRLDSPGEKRQIKKAKRKS